MRRLLLLVALLGAAPPGLAQSLKPDEVLSSVTVAPINAANPVLGADGKVHLAYELVVTNPSTLFVTLDKIEALGADGPVHGLDGDALTRMMVSHAGGGRTLAPGTAGIVFMDVTFPPDAKLPDRLLHRIIAKRQNRGEDSKPTPLPPASPFPAVFTFAGVPVAIGKPAVVVAPPLRGKGWVVVNGCCDAVTSHRGAVMAVNGRLRVPERFAIDFVKLDAGDRLFSGDVHKLGSYAFYGTPVHAAADGRVVNTYDATDEQVPGGEARGITPESVGGNMVVVDIGDGNYAFYAHLQRGSLKVKPGDSVKTGDVLGLLGNTGNSSAPHLHFHVMDGISPLDANSLPYVFTRFEGMGRVDPDAADFFDKPVAAPVDPHILAGPRRNALPLDNQVVGFGDGK